MDLREITNSLVVELTKFNTAAFDGDDFTGFSTGRNGVQCGFNKQFKVYLAQLSREIYRNLGKPIEIEEKQFRKILEESIVNLFTEDNLRIEEINSKENLKKIREELSNNLNNLNDEYIHYIPAKTAQLELFSPIKLGCVEIFSIKHWLEKVDYSELAKERYPGNTEQNKIWKELVIRKLSNEEINLEGIAKDIFRILEGNNAVLKVKVKGYERELSKKFGNILAKSVLDMLSLHIGSRRIFFKQILQADRYWPKMTFTLMGDDKHLGGPGFKLSEQHFQIFKDEIQLKEYRAMLNEFLPYFENILDGLTNKDNCMYPKLANKWIYALNWYAEGIRESNDAIAVAKLASCLDTLSHGSKISGIKQLLRNIFDREDHNILFNIEGNQKITIHEFAKRVYEEGRSRILHGTIDNLLESFQADKERLIYAGRIVLLECAERLSQYDGEDSEHAFKTMKRKN
ncbi:Uncharacterised protein [Acinetobacter baumannii]|uniref:hypothetical protein n=1 Tax=Acinetobacter baumannii TaxID=470 RepID=UPI000DE6E3CB|nr:hypothetical protein [Acinetobacter baumannii]SSO97938.1 Uncharacterised protein [Acinetobacter baumannii]HAV5432060.1 hypothetical protein [Acinetobacter baumannii]